MPHPLLQAWHDCPLDKSPYLLPGDEVILGKPGWYSTFGSYEEFTSSPDFLAAPTRLHLGLLPQPYVGNLEHAQVFLLMLNPGFCPGDYYAEQYVPDFRKALIQNIRQESHEGDYPIPFLNPAYAWTMGGVWWLDKMNGVAQHIAKQRRITIQNALSHVSRHTACLEMYPYHSQRFDSSAKLESRRLMLSYVKEVVIPKVHRGDAIMVVTRKVAEWNLQQHENIVQYNAGQSRGAHLTLKTSGGEAIVSRLLNIP